MRRAGPDCCTIDGCRECVVGTASRRQSWRRHVRMAAKRRPSTIIIQPAAAASTTRPPESLAMPLPGASSRPGIAISEFPKAMLLSLLPR